MAKTKIERIKKSFESIEEVVNMKPEDLITIVEPQINKETLEEDSKLISSMIGGDNNNKESNIKASKIEKGIKEYINDSRAKKENAKSPIYLYSDNDIFIDTIANVFGITKTSAINFIVKEFLDNNKKSIQNTASYTEYLKRFSL